MENRDVLEVLSKIFHPQTHKPVTEGGIVEQVRAGEGKIDIVLRFVLPRDPFAVGIKREVVKAVSAAFPDKKINVLIKEGAPSRADPLEKLREGSGAQGIGRVIAVSSGKGGVGKSSVTANLAVLLAQQGYRVGILDADVYGPSQAAMFGVKEYRPGVVMQGEKEMFLPAEAYGVKVMSIGFFISPDDALVWRGPMATGALRQLVHQTAWGGLDFLLVDLPPGTGDIHLTVLQELKIDGAVIVSTPQGIALADVLRGIGMFRAEKIGVEVLGIVENMSWFTPLEHPGEKYYIFGKGGARAMAGELGVPFLGGIPIMVSVMEGAEKGRPDAVDNSFLKEYYSGVIKAVTKKRDC